MEKLLKISVIYCCLAATSRKCKITPYTDVIRHHNIANHRSILMRLPCEQLYLREPTDGMTGCGYACCLR